MWTHVLRRFSSCGNHHNGQHGIKHNTDSWPYFTDYFEEKIKKEPLCKIAMQQHQFAQGHFLFDGFKGGWTSCNKVTLLRRELGMAAMLQHVPSLQGNMTWYRCPRKLEGHMEGTTQKNKSNFGLAYDCSTVLDQRVPTDAHLPRPSKSHVLHRREQGRKSENGQETFVCRMRTEEARRSYA